MIAGALVGHDIGDLLAEAAQVIGALALLISAVALLMLIARHGFKGMTAKFGKAELSLEAVDQKLDRVMGVVEKVNLATNNVPEGEPSLIQEMKEQSGRIKSLEDQHRWVADSLHAIARRVGIVNLPASPLDRRTGEPTAATVEP